MKHRYLLIYLILLLLNVICIYPQSSSLLFLNETLSQNDKSMKRISGGKLLWTDSPSSRAIYEKLESHVIFLSMHMRNNKDIISYYSSREGYLDNITATLQRVRELILKRSNSFYSSEDKEIIDSEIYLLYSGILKELSWAQFNTISIFSSWLKDENLKNIFKEENFYTIDGIDKIIQAVLSERAKIGATINTLKHRERWLSIEQENTIAFQSNDDTDFTIQLSNMKRNEILFFSNIFLLKQQK